MELAQVPDPKTGAALGELSRTLGAFLAKPLRVRYGDDWEEACLRDLRLPAKGRAPLADPYVQLRILEQHRDVLARDVPADALALVPRALRARNAWAHMHPLTRSEADEATAVLRGLVARLVDAGASLPSTAAHPAVHTIESQWSWWVAGTPAPFATRGEKPWKQAIKDQSPAPDGGVPVSGLELRFSLRGAREGYHAADLDNLLEPTLSALVNARGWFGRARPNIGWLFASKEHAEEAGCRLTVRQDQPADDLVELSARLLDDVYRGVFPRSARDADFAAWVRERAHGPLGDRRAVVCLGFGGRRVNLGAISEGAVKAITDCLWPIMGGRAGRSEDWRIGELLLSKGVPTLPDDAVRVTVAAL